MSATGLILFIVIGLVAGWLAGQIVKGGGYGIVGDIIVGVNQEAVTSPQDVVRIASAVKGKLLLQVIRDDSALFIVIG